jgi:hypothetical protein
MKRSIFVLGIISIALVMFFLFSGCATLNEENYANGKFFVDLHLEYYNKSIPIEEQCYLVILPDAYTLNGTGIISINGKKPSMMVNRLNRLALTVLPPGKHNLLISYLAEGNIRIDTNTVNMTVNLSGGHYYVLTSSRKNDTVNFELSDLENYSSLFVSGIADSPSMMMPVETIIKGINSRIAVKYKGFEGGKKAANDEFIKLMVINNLSIPIVHLYIRPAGENTWEDILRRPIPPGEGIVHDSLSRNKYDIRAEDNAGNTYSFLNEDFLGADGAVGRTFLIEINKRDKK